jgi:hypothetical protein
MLSTGIDAAMFHFTPLDDVQKYLALSEINSCYTYVGSAGSLASSRWLL